MSGVDTLDSAAASSGDRDVLMIVYRRCGGAQWSSNSKWGTEAPLDQWHGVKTKGDVVVGLDLRNNNLEGECLPARRRLAELFWHLAEKASPLVIACLDKRETMSVR